jgi:hypothetical protein
MSTHHGPVRYITLADDNHQPVGVVANGGADWPLNCRQRSHATPSRCPHAGVAELLEHIELGHSAGRFVEVIDVDQGR